MLHSIKELEEYSIVATDGAIGSIKDFYFDDDVWAIRYLVVDTSIWPPGRKVLLSPFSIEHSNQTARVFTVSVSKEQIDKSPSIDTQKPVSRQHEIRYLEYYNCPYWGGCGVWGQGAYPGMMLTGSAYGLSDAAYGRVRASNERIAAEAEEERRQEEDPHLRSCHAVEQYNVHATDGDIGHVDGFLVAEHSWAIRYLIVNTSNCWLGHQVLVAPGRIIEVSWSDAKVTVSLSRQEIKDARTYDSDVPPDLERGPRIQQMQTDQIPTNAGTSSSAESLSVVAPEGMGPRAS
jgi:hypothetical protein